MHKPKNTVYWLTYKEYDYPQSENWVNDIYTLYDSLIEEGETYENMVELIFNQMLKDKNDNYVMVVDIDKVNEQYIVANRFISNNVIFINQTYSKEKISKQIEWILSDFGMDKQMIDNTWFTSDTHFYHRNIIKYCNRPWSHAFDDKVEMIVTDEDVEKMNEDMISLWNSVVGQNDIVWHLGDFCLGPKQTETIPDIVSKLNGKINLVLGNHDRHSVKFYYDAGFNRVYDRKIIINDYIVLSHAPMEFVKSPFFNIYGHVHDCSTYKTWSKDSCCVCVERHGYKPVSWKDIQKHYDEENNDLQHN